MKTMFTPFQIILTTVSCSAFTLCMIGDVFIILFDKGTVGGNLPLINLVLSAAALVLSVLFIFKVNIVNTFSGRPDAQSDTEPAIKALRTYFCMLSFDFAGVLLFMLAGSLLYKNAAKAIVVFAPAVFLIAAVTYFVRVSRIGLEDYSDTDEDFGENTGSDHDDDTIL